MLDIKKQPLLQAVLLSFLSLTVNGLEKIYEYQRYDGWYNNLANPHWGTVGSHLHRDAPSRYQDGVYMLNTDLPSARAISELIFKGPSGIPNKRNVTTMLAFFSQVIAYEIMQSTLISCPLEMHKIPVPRCDAVFDAQCMGKTEIPFVRAKYDKNTGHGFNVPREQNCRYILGVKIRTRTASVQKLRVKLTVLQNSNLLNQYDFKAPQARNVVIFIL